MATPECAFRSVHYLLMQGLPLQAPITLDPAWEAKSSYASTYCKILFVNVTLSTDNKTTYLKNIIVNAHLRYHWCCTVAKPELSRDEMSPDHGPLVLIHLVVV